MGTDMLETVLIVVAARITAYILLVGMSTSVDPLSNFAAFLGEFFVRPFNVNGGAPGREHSRRRIEDEIDRELGKSDPWGRQARTDVIQATVQAQRIRIMDQKCRAAIRTCVRTHWSVAQGLGASHLSEAMDMYQVSNGQIRETWHVEDVAGMLKQMEIMR
jgi:hypothetical protein